MKQLVRNVKILGTGFYVPMTINLIVNLKPYY